MKVKELKEILEKLDPEENILFYGQEGVFRNINFVDCVRLNCVADVKAYLLIPGSVCFTY